MNYQPIVLEDNCFHDSVTSLDMCSDDPDGLWTAWSTALLKSTFPVISNFALLMAYPGQTPEQISIL